MPSPLPIYLDDAPAMLGGELQPHEVTVAVNLHEELLLALPEAAARAGSRALLVPSEAPGWTSGWVRNQVKTACRKLGMGCDFPKPFCSMRRGRHPALDAVMDHFHIGRPEIKLEIADGLIREARVLTSAPCGNTYFVAFNLKGAPADERAVEDVARYWHSFPCVPPWRWTVTPGTPSSTWAATSTTKPCAPPWRPRASTSMFPRPSTRCEPGPAWAGMVT